MAFGPGIKSLADALINQPYSAEYVTIANEAGVPQSKIMVIEFKMWVDYIQAVGDKETASEAIEWAREEYFKNVVGFLSDPNLDADDIRDIFDQLQICATKAGVIASAAALPDPIVSFTTFKDACNMVRNSATADPACN